MNQNKQNMKYNYIIVFSILLITACGKKDIDFDACGEINATEITVSAENSGRLISLDIEEGDKIAEGQTVGIIDSVQTYLKMKELIRRKEGAAIKRIDIKCQMEGKYAQLDKLEKDLVRYRGLLESEAGTQKQVDDLEGELAILKGEISAAEQSYRQNNDGIENEINTLSVQIDQTADMLEKCKIKSPVSGTVLTKYVEEGEQVSSGKPVFKIADLSKVYVRAYFTTEQLKNLALGDKVTVIPDDGSDNPKKYEGTVTWISDDAEFTPKNIQTRDERADLVYAVKITVNNDGQLRLGMYAYIKK